MWSRLFRVLRLLCLCYWASMHAKNFYFYLFFFSSINESLFNIQFKPQWLICICILCRNHSHLHAKTQPWANWIVSAETVVVWISGYPSSICLNDETKQTDHITNHTSYCTVFVYTCLGRNPGLSLHCHKEDDRRGKIDKMQGTRKSNPPAKLIRSMGIFFQAGEQGMNRKHDSAGC